MKGARLVTTGNTSSARTRNLVIAAATTIVAAFLLGFFPQFRNASRLRDELRVRDQRIEQLEREAKLVESAGPGQSASPPIDTQKLRNSRSARDCILRPCSSNDDRHFERSVKKYA